MLRVISIVAICILLVLPQPGSAINLNRQANIMRSESGVGRQQNPSDPCQGKPDQKTCDASAECTWCKAAAVPSSCFTVVSKARGILT